MVSTALSSVQGLLDGMYRSFTGRVGLVRSVNTTGDRHDGGTVPYSLVHPPLLQPMLSFDLMRCRR